MRDILDAVKSYFEEKNRTWITLDTRTLARSAAVPEDSPWWRVVRHGISAKKREIGHRRSKLLRAHTKVTIRDLQTVTPSHAVELMADELVTWVHRDGGDYGVTSRCIRHHQHWKYKGDKWVLSRDSESDELHKDFRVSDGLTDREASTESQPFSWSVNRACVEYDRVRVLRYAELWWNGKNPAFPRFADDCTNFISQCLYAGNLPPTGGSNRSVGWWYTAQNWSYSWSTSHALYKYLHSQVGATSLNNPRDLKIGDVIFYDWTGSGTYHHTTVVVDFDASGDPLVNAHTDDSYHRHYLYLDSRAWTDNTRYAFLHVPDNLC